MLGKCMPTQEKLVCLANLLDTSPEQLRFGRSNEKTLVAKFGDGLEEVANVDQQFFKRYLALTRLRKAYFSYVLVFIHLVGNFVGKRRQHSCNCLKQRSCV